MARIRLRRPDQPWWLQVLLGVYEFLASLELAVPLLLLLCVVLAFGTLVEKWYGTPGAQFGVYQTWWFLTLGVLLAVNIFCAAAIRFPWKKYQTGFVITHLGLLVLLFGCLVKNRWGIDAQMPLFEDTTNRYALEDQSVLELTVVPHAQKNKGHGQIHTVTIPLRTGPFNWRDYEHLSWFPWHLAHRDQGLLDHPALKKLGIQIELLDFYANCQEIHTPAVELRISPPEREVVDPETGKVVRRRVPEDQWQEVFLAVRPSGRSDQQGRGRPMRRRVGGGTIVFWLAPSREETLAFLQCLPPEDPKSYGPRGVVVLRVRQSVFTVPVDKLSRDEDFLLDSDIRVRLLSYQEHIGGPHENLGAGIVLRVSSGQKHSELTLFANYPEMNILDPNQQVFGYLYVPQLKVSSRELMAGRGGSRIDIIQGVDAQGQPRLFYRYWNRRQVVFARELPADGSLVSGFRMPVGELKMKVARYFPSLRPSFVLEPLPYDKELTAPSSRRAARLRVRMDGLTEEFWITGPPYDPISTPPPSSRYTITSKTRSVMFRFPVKQVDVGFLVRLKKFHRKLEPGTNRPIYYGSTVDFLDPDTEAVLRENVLIELNEPVDFRPLGQREGWTAWIRDWLFSGYYRFFQESFSGPFMPGDDVYELFYIRHPELASRKRDKLYLSTLTVNYDPGRGWVYLGCLLVVVGVFTMFYMRAYFFRPRRRVPLDASASGVGKSTARGRKRSPAMAATASERSSSRGS